jgi:L-alanine-DL-glutamate epimerase-like enolase superfamily enzyme
MAEFFGSRPSPVTTDVTLGIDSLEKTRSKAKDAQKREFGHIKLKTGNDIKQDLKRIEIVSTEMDNPCIKVDANQGWSPKETERFASRVKEAGVDLELIEQPVEANDLKGLKEAKRRVDVPIAADESVFCKEDALKVAGMRAADIINIKTGKTGLIESQQIVSIAEAAGLDLMIGCNIESRIGIHTAAHMVSGTGSFSYVDLDGAPIMSEGIKDSSHGPKINIQGPGHGEHDY